MLDDGQGQPPRRLLWVGAIDGSVVAHAQVACDWRHGVARLARVCVDPASRGRKIGRRFLGSIVEAIFRDPRIRAHRAQRLHLQSRGDRGLSQPRLRPGRQPQIGGESGGGALGFRDFRASRSEYATDLASGRESRATPTGSGARRTPLTFH